MGTQRIIELEWDREGDRYLSVNGSRMTSGRDVADWLAGAISKSSSAKSGDQWFLGLRQGTEEQKLDFESNSSGRCNLAFTLEELNELEGAHKCSCEPG